MTFELFSRVALRTNVAEYGLRRGAVATIVDYHPVHEDEDGWL